MPLSDPADRSVMVEYDPFEDAVKPTVPGVAKNVRPDNPQIVNKNPSLSPVTPPAVMAGDPKFTSYEDGWDDIDGPVYYSTNTQHEDPHSVLKKDFKALVNTAVPDEYPHPSRPTPVMGRMPQPLHHEPYHSSHWGGISKQTGAGNKTWKKDYGDTLRKEFESLAEKVAHMEQELGVTIVHIIHDGTSWIRKGHHHDVKLVQVENSSLADGGKKAPEESHHDEAEAGVCGGACISGRNSEASAWY